MRYLFTFLITIVFMSCSSGNGIDTTDDDPVGSDIALSFKWENEILASLPLAMVYDKLERSYLFLAAKSGGLMILNDNDERTYTNSKCTY